MFTGIITDIGRIRDMQDLGGVRRLIIDTVYVVDSIDIGASIACSGACLTVVDKVAKGFMVEVSNETLSKTTIGDWCAGTEINLERAMCLGDEIGGHLVSGHVDGICECVSCIPDGDCVRLLFEVPDSLARFLAPKGSVALDGASLTVNEVEGCRFGVNIIPHTLTCTTLKNAKTNSRHNLEVDQIARYLERLSQPYLSTSD